MNERIEKLAEQANAWYPMGYPSGEGGDAAWENLVIFEKEDLKKFAELIVRECADVLVAEMNRLDGLDRVVSAQTMDTAQILIKQHFGVEE